jgi:DNA modification methylase
MLSEQQLLTELGYSPLKHHNESLKDTFLLPSGRSIPVLSNEFWTSSQRRSHSIHEVSYRACFKAELPAFFIKRLSPEGGLVFDPFMGRGTTLIEAALEGRKVAGCDVNPLSLKLFEPRLTPPKITDVERRIESVLAKKSANPCFPEELLHFYHPDTLQEIMGLKSHFNQGDIDDIDKWIAMAATTRLTGHSTGFFSVYSMPPNQAVLPERQKIINQRRNQTPEYRPIAPRIIKKSRALLRDCDEFSRNRLNAANATAQLETCSANHLKWLRSNSVDLVVTSPPFLDVIDYATDNWLRAWFNGFDTKDIAIWKFAKLSEWSSMMLLVLRELCRVLKPGAWVAFEVGEVNKGRVFLECEIASIAESSGLKPIAIMVNQQKFTKTAACWGIENSKKGTNSNRIVIMRKPISS